MKFKPSLMIKCILPDNPGLIPLLTEALFRKINTQWPDAQLKKMIPKNGVNFIVLMRISTRLRRNIDPKIPLPEPAIIENVKNR